jgi:RND family efflux transporter MFP subunit
MTAWRLTVGLAFLAVLGGCGAAKPPPPRETPPVPVSLATVGAAPATESIGGTGTVRYRNEIALGFTTAGKIARLPVQEGDRVRAGQLLAQLDTTTVNADSKAARAELERANAQLRRLTELSAKGWITKPQLEQAQATQRAAAARVEATGFAAETATITAPSAGTVLQRIGAPGQVVPAGSPVLVLGEQSGGLVIRVPLSDGDLARLRIGMPASITLPALGAEPISGQISEIGGRADTQSGTFGVQITLASDPRLMSGQIGEVRFTVSAAQGERNLVVPSTALFDVRVGEGFVYVVDASMRAHARRVTIGRLDDRTVEIRAGLKAGERIVARGHERLVENGQVVPAASGR